ncbi:MAG: hypothetical protein GDA53_11850 [Rhodobacteraceae bacterium]|nr:hypothetical protein [Paracoccaceae bacterium]
MRRFPKQYAGKIVTSRQIRQVAGDVAEWARRQRVLRDEGWRISSRNDRAELKPGEYVPVQYVPPAAHRCATLAVAARMATGSDLPPCKQPSVRTMLRWDMIPL